MLCYFGLGVCGVCLFGILVCRFVLWDWIVALTVCLFVLMFVI